MESSAEKAAVNISFCPACGAKCRASDIYCDSCGYHLKKRPNSRSGNSYGQSGSASDHDTCAEAKYIGKNTTYYIYKFRDMRLRNSILSWNWAAAFFGPYWLFYRKMYVLGAVLAIIETCALGYVLTLSDKFLLVVHAIIGFLGNNIYMQHIENLVANERKIEEPNRTSFCNKKGGVSVLAVIILFVIVIAVTGYFQIIL